MVYPKKHRRIVGDLLAGKFILQKSDLFDTITQSFKEFYITFFEESFGHELKITAQYVFLISFETNSNLSKNISIFLAILCFELDREGKNFSSEIKTGYYDIEEVNQKLLESEYKDIIQNINEISNLRSLIRQMNDRNIVEMKGDNRFIFTSAIEIFFNFAEEYLKQKIESEINIVNNLNNSDLDIEM